MMVSMQIAANTNTIRYTIVIRIDIISLLSESTLKRVQSYIKGHSEPVIIPKIVISTPTIEIIQIFLLDLSIFIAVVDL